MLAAAKNSQHNDNELRCRFSADASQVLKLGWTQMRSSVTHNSVMNFPGSRFNSNSLTSKQSSW